MVYSWKLPMKVSAEKAAEVLDGLYAEKGVISPADIVEASRAEDAPLHCLFEWDDTVAAEKFRETQARFIIRNIQRVEEKEGVAPVRNFVHVEKDYVPISAALSTDEMRAQLLQNALKDFEAFRAKYHNLIAFAEVFEAFDALKESLEEKPPQVVGTPKTADQSCTSVIIRQRKEKINVTQYA